MNEKIKQFWFASTDTIRLDTFRVILGIFLFIYMVERFKYAGEWLTPVGFHPSSAFLSYHPLSVPLLSESMLPIFGLLLFGSIIALTLGIFTRWSVWVVLLCVSYVTFADQWAAYTLNKLSIVSLLVLACATKGSYWSLTDKNSNTQSVWPIRILQATLIIHYFTAGWNKAVLGDWLSNPYVLWSQMQGFYRTDIAAWMLNNLSLKTWAFMQSGALAFELLAPVLFIIKRTRVIAFIWGSLFQLMIAVSMHQLIYFMLIMWCFYVFFMKDETLHRIRFFLNGLIKRKSIAAISLCFLATTLSGCDQIYGLLQKEGAEEKEIVGEVLPLEKNPNIEEVQKLLEIYGYDPGKVDGILGRRTRDAIERFQKDHELKETRFVDQETWQRLKIFKDKGFVVEGKLNTKKIQTALKEAGFDPGSVDGKFGQKTKEAVIAFQKAHNLKVDGKVGYRTLTALSIYVP